MIYGPNTKAVQAIIDRILTLTEEEVNRLGADRSAAWYAAWYAARSAAWGADRSAARYAAWSATIDAAWSADRSAAWSATWDAIIATVTYDLATIDGPYTIAHRDLLLAPWVEVCGMPANEPGGTGHRAQGGSTPHACNFSADQPTEGLAI